MKRHRLRRCPADKFRRAPYGARGLKPMPRLTGTSVGCRAPYGARGLKLGKLQG